jgi:hypothetical protein
MVNISRRGGKFLFRITARTIDAAPTANRLITFVIYREGSSLSAGKPMVALLGVTSLLAGVGVACAADYAPARVAAMESWGGRLLVAGLALLGMAFGAIDPSVY